MKTINKVIAILTPHERRRGVLVVVVVMFMALIETVGIASVMPFLTFLGNPELVNTNHLLNAVYLRAQIIGINTPNGFLFFLGVATFLFIVFTALSRVVSQYIVTSFIQMSRYSLAVRLLENYLYQPYAFFINRHSGDMLKNLLSEVDSVIGGVITPLYNIASSTLILVLVTVLLLIVNPFLAILTGLLIGALYGIVFIVVKDKLLRLGKQRLDANKERFVIAGEALAGIKNIKLLGKERDYLIRFSGPNYKISRITVFSQIIKHIPNSLVEIIVFGAMILVALFLMSSVGGVDSNSLGEALPVLGLYAIAAYRIKPAVSLIFDASSSLRYSRVSLNTIHADLHLNNTLISLPTIKAPVKLKAKRSIVLEHLSYSYPNAAKQTITDLNIEIPVGSTLGIAGTTGAGKTTLVDLLLGLLRPTQGVISIDGAPLLNEQIRAWQNTLGYVPQEIFLTDGTIAENIAFGVPRKRINHAQVEQCARMAQVHDFIVNDLPAQYETAVGERGVRLSGGQRQRIGIARALYHDPDLVVFDEATSALDSMTEREVMVAIGALSQQKKTIIIIAHRLSTLKGCDQIVLLDGGVIRASGTFNELLANNRLFGSWANTS